MKGFFSDLEKLAEGVFDPKLLSWGCSFCQDHVQPLCSAKGSREGDEREEELSGAEGSLASLWAGQSKGTVHAHPLGQPRFRWLCSSYLMLGVQNELSRLLWGGHLRATGTSGEQLIPFHYRCDELLFWCADLHQLQRNPSLMTNGGWDESYHPSEVGFLWKMSVPGKWKHFV